ncbi:MAG TPA: ABC transporter permease [Gemmatimonadales bacterium]|jgi:ABC-type multidrug transport system permease subunit|nr:ABC transporter permease [Gemmatimonadales bacterium]
MSEPRWSAHPLVQLTRVRYREFFREPEAVFWVFIFPVLLAAGLGLAFRNQAPARTAVAVVSGMPESSRLADALQHERDMMVSLLSDSAAGEALRVGEVALTVVPGPSGEVEYRYDQSRPESRTARLLVDDAIQRAGGRANSLQVRDQLVHDPGARYIDFLIPGLLGMNLMGSGIWGLGFAIVDARKKRLLKRLIATPMSRAQYLSSFVLSRLTLLCLEVVLLLGFGVLAFGVPLRGSLVLLALICLLSSLAFSSLGLLISSRAQTMEGASGLMNLVMLPMWIFSGVFFSASRFPEQIQPLIQALPLTAVIDALRANTLRGAGLSAVAPELGIIAAWMALSFLLALKLFRWR